MDGMLDKLHQLELLLEENQPASADLYVDAPSFVVTAVVRDIQRAPDADLETSLAIGVTENEYRVMLRVAKVGQLPDADVAARLFSDGRVLADPPDETGTPQFQVHPLLEPALERYRDAVKGEG
jgi:hypothetical protein